jgi:hypothetical protein
MNAFPHLKTIEVTAFENKATEPELAQDLQFYLAEKFQSDGRLKISTIHPHVRLEGTVLDYVVEIYGYDIIGTVSEYQVKLLISITMTDLVNSEKMYENTQLLLSEQYSTNFALSTGLSSNERYTSEDEAKKRIFEKTFDTLISNTLEQW